MSRRTAHDVLKAAFEAAGLNGHLATHSLRNSFAQRLYDRTGDIFAVQEMLGHKNVATTQKYLGCQLRLRPGCVRGNGGKWSTAHNSAFGQFTEIYYRRNLISRTRSPRIRPLKTPRRRNDCGNCQVRVKRSL